MATLTSKQKELSAADLMLACPCPKPFNRKGWVFEMKYDGFRVLAIKQGKLVKLLSRRNRDMSLSFPEIVASMQDLPNIAVDGELVVLNDLGVPQFERLRWRSLMRIHKEIVHASAKEPAAIFAFDLLSLKGKDMQRRPLLYRKEVLREAIADASRIKYASHIWERGEALYDQVDKLEVEGIVAKRSDSTYVAGRSKDWLKIKTPAGRAMEDHRLRHLKNR